jgi:hypothetical protein
MVLACSAVLVSAASLAQSAPPPMVGDKPLVQVKPRKAAKENAKENVKQAAMKPQSTAVRLQACLEIDDETKERLNCYDAVIAPAPNPKAPNNPKAAKAKTVGECRFTKEEDERLTCFNGFVESMPKLPKS